MRDVKRYFLRRAQKMPLNRSKPQNMKDFSTIGELDADTDMVNSPAHYTQGRVEVIDVIEDAIKMHQQ